MLKKLNLNATKDGTDIKLAVKDLSKTYGSFTALHPTDLELKAGEFMTLLGPSGSGKRHFDDGGRFAEFRLRRPLDRRSSHHECSPWERGIGMVFQNYALFPI